MSFAFNDQGRAEDIINRHRFLYYVEQKPVIPDAQYDALERHIAGLWSVSVCMDVGSDDRGDYARYIQEGRRPGKTEREERDKAIVARWMEAL